MRKKVTAIVLALSLLRGGGTALADEHDSDVTVTDEETPATIIADCNDLTVVVEQVGPSTGRFGSWGQILRNGNVVHEPGTVREQNWRTTDNSLIIAIALGAGNYGVEGDTKYQLTGLDEDNPCAVFIEGEYLNSWRKLPA